MAGRRLSQAKRAMPALMESLAASVDAPIREDVLDLVKLIEQGYTIDLAAVVMGRPKESLLAELEGSPLLAQQVREAESVFLGRLLDKINSSSDWKAAQWMLTVRYPHVYATAEVVESALKRLHRQHDPKYRKKQAEGADGSTDGAGTGCAVAAFDRPI